MISTGNIKTIRKKDYDEVWAIVRSLKVPNPNISWQVQSLAPSYKLFQIYLDLKNQNKWNKETFEKIYKPKFLEEIKKSPEAQQMLNELCLLDKKGRNICLVCFCDEYSLCHRSLIAELLEGKDCKVIKEGSL